MPAQSAVAPGGRTLSRKDSMTLRAVKPGEIEITWQLQSVELNPILERIAREPHRAGAQRCETVAKTSPQRAQPRTPGLVGEHHQHRRRNSLLNGCARA